MITPTHRIKWKNIAIGDHAYLSFNYQGNNSVRIVPRAGGVIIRSTKELGGGVLSITVKSVIVKNNRLEIEAFFNTLNSVFSLTEPGDILIDDTLTLINCYLDSFSQDGEDLLLSPFTFNFTKSL